MDPINNHDTIAALATGAGPSAIAIVRLSGKDSLSVSDQLFMPISNKNKPSTWYTHTLGYGHILDGDVVVDEVLLTVMRAPKTYTREDVVEINCHGGTMAARRILRLLLREGVRMAQPGEFTLRAFLNGRIDLAQAEAVNQLIRSSTETAQQMALRQLRGGLSQRIRELDERLLEIRSGVEGSLDFPDDVDFPASKELDRELAQLLEELDRLLTSSHNGRLLAEGVRVVIAGKPNVGKSSLLNRLLEEERALVSPEPGTTRDAVDASVEWEGFQLSITDTAGIRDRAESVEQMGIEFARNRIAEADLVLLVLDRSEPWSLHDRSLAETVMRKSGICVLNKNDLSARLEEKDLPAHLATWPRTEVSCLTGDGLEGLRNLLTEAIWSGRVPDPVSEILVCEARHVEALSQAKNALQRVQTCRASNQPLDMVAQELREAHEALGKIVGRTAPEELLDAIFSRFCVGK